jgi:hypothetical protein
LLGMEKTFMKDQRAGTEIIVVATVMLVDAGPMATDVVIHPDFGAPPTAFWLIFLGCLWIASGVGMVQDALGYPLSVNVQMAIYVLAQGIGTSATTTLGKLLSLESGFILALVGLLYVAAGATNTVSSIIAGPTSPLTRPPTPSPLTQTPNPKPPARTNERERCSEGAVSTRSAAHHTAVCARCARSEEAQPGRLYPIRLRLFPRPQPDDRAARVGRWALTLDCALALTLPLTLTSRATRRRREVPAPHRDLPARMDLRRPAGRHTRRCVCVRRRLEVHLAVGDVHWDPCADRVGHLRPLQRGLQDLRVRRHRWVWQVHLAEELQQDALDRRVLETVHARGQAGGREEEEPREARVDNRVPGAGAAAGRAERQAALDERGRGDRRSSVAVARRGRRAARHPPHTTPGPVERGRSHGEGYSALRRCLPRDRLALGTNALSECDACTLGERSTLCGMPGLTMRASRSAVVATLTGPRICTRHAHASMHRL